MTNKEAVEQIILGRVERGMLGPGAGRGTLAEELMDQIPLLTYYTGVLYPLNHRARPSISASGLEDDAGTGQDEQQGSNQDEADTTLIASPGQSENQGTMAASEDEAGESTEAVADGESLATSAFYPSSMGISFCLPAEVKQIQVLIQGGRYTPATQAQRRVAISENQFGDLMQGLREVGSSLSNGLAFDHEREELFVTDDQAAQARAREFGDRHILFDRLSGLRKKLKDKPALHLVDKLYILLGTAYKRQEITVPKTVQLDKTGECPIQMPDHDKELGSLEISLFVRVYTGRNGGQYVRLQLINKSQVLAQGRDKDSSRELNACCLFQASLRVELAPGQVFLPYQDRSTARNRDEEHKALELAYADVHAYAVGHNTSATWELATKTEKSWVATAWVPKVWAAKVSNDITEQSEAASQVLTLEHLVSQRASTVALDDATLLAGLEQFAKGYQDWHQMQAAEAKLLDQNKRLVGEAVVAKQGQALARISAGIELLAQEPEAMDAFRLANLAMHIQMMLGKDKRFGGGAHKSITADALQGLADLAAFIPFAQSGATDAPPAYRPFQLAFLLMALPGVFYQEDTTGRDVVDLIWFPTGGGKTEAYLALTAFTIALRRMRYPGVDGQGTTVLMRYTLRLLTAQQFERASRLICALEFLRIQAGYGQQLGTTPITIGLYVGGGSTPNTLDDARKMVNDIKEKHTEDDLRKANKAAVDSCPWCGRPLIHAKIDGLQDHLGGRRLGIHYEDKPAGKLELSCIQKGCFYNSSRLPILVVDEELYENPPTLLFGTVDKFAQLAWKAQARQLFGHGSGHNPPELIIQDELHLLTGPLGSTVGLFETVVDRLCRNKFGVGPKIVTSTATTRNTQNQITALYGKEKQVSVFPAPGLRHNDSYFARQSTRIADSKRLYTGFFPTGKTTQETQLHLLTHLLVARLEVLDQERQQGGDEYILADACWTILAYYNSLRDVGVAKSQVGESIKRRVKELQERVFAGRDGAKLDFNFLRLGNQDAIEELTSRVASHEIKGQLSKMEKKLTQASFTEKDGRRFLVGEVVDMVMATNMVSVGVDVARFNVMLMAGMPRTVAEYIQASSRVARRDEGLMMLLISPMRARERSHYEHFTAFHQAFYRFVEPLSATPCTEITLERMLPTLLAAYVRCLEEGMAPDDAAKRFQPQMAHRLTGLLRERFTLGADMDDYLAKLMHKLSKEWTRQAGKDNFVYHGGEKYNPLLRNPSKTGGKAADDMGNPTWMVLQSMREVGEEAWIWLYRAMIASPRTETEIQEQPEIQSYS